MCMELLKAGHGRRRACGPSVLLQGGDSGLSRWPPLHPWPACPVPVPVGAKMAKKREQMVETPSSVPSQVTRDWLAEGEVPTLVLRSAHRACPQSIRENKDGFSETLPRPPLLPLPQTMASLPKQAGRGTPKVPDMWVTCPQAGAKPRVSRKGCSWVLAIKWGPGARRGLEAASPSTATPASAGLQRGRASIPRSVARLGWRAGCLGHRLSCTSGPPCPVDRAIPGPQQG